MKFNRTYPEYLYYYSNYNYSEMITRMMQSIEEYFN